MSKGPGKYQRKALELCAPSDAIISPQELAWEVAEQKPTDAQWRAARRALQTLSTKGLITDHGYGGGGQKMYGRPQALKILLAKSYAEAIAEVRREARECRQKLA